MEIIMVNTTHIHEMQIANSDSNHGYYEVCDLSGTGHGACFIEVYSHFFQENEQIRSQILIVTMRVCDFQNLKNGGNFLIRSQTL